jgi:hypothetical protein
MGRQHSFAFVARVVLQRCVIDALSTTTGCDAGRAPTHLSCSDASSMDFEQKQHVMPGRIKTFTA